MPDRIPSPFRDDMWVAPRTFMIYAAHHPPIGMSFLWMPTLHHVVRS